MTNNESHYSTSHVRDSTDRLPGSSSPKSSAFQKLCRKLSPKKSDKRTLSVEPNAPKYGELDRVFRYLDENGDGKISPEELQSCVRMVGGEMSTEEAEAAVESSDSDGDGLFGYDDFVKLMEVSGEEERQKDLREAFGMYEMEGSGFITPTSLKRMMSRLGESRTIGQCKDIIKSFDLNGDGVLSFDEFRAMMR
ncbi:PREDICTED: calcium-binding protein CML38-like [Nelumbo nucifera]|uniref:Calcium-binding protein CML38-like n=1 Tax=Nelumbo nucifera TaxID=4432 RepID=A0A1U8ART9_NELNU|nr:PREDICTED: calcium-binding protein CML38-like [Nelumbo nucifera]